VLEPRGVSHAEHLHIDPLDAALSSVDRASEEEWKAQSGADDPPRLRSPRDRLTENQPVADRLDYLGPPATETSHERTIGKGRRD